MGTDFEFPPTSISRNQTIVEGGNLLSVPTFPARFPVRFHSRKLQPQGVRSCEKIETTDVGQTFSLRLASANLP